MADTIASIDGAVATLTLNRPAALNALSHDMIYGIRDFATKVERDDSIRCVVIKGAGSHFMAGGDLKWFLTKFESPAGERRIGFEQMINNVHESIFAFRRMRKPVIGSVEGACAGFGLSLALACDLIVAADSAFFTLAYTNIGTSPDGGSTFSLPRMVGMKTAMEIALLGDRFDAATAKARGLVNFVVPATDLQAETAKLASRVVALPAFAAANTKALLNASLGRSIEGQLHAEAESFAACAATEDMREGITAFIQKRKPVYSGQ
jgi:2-(1,2-epoxy-1,2-dihydrophenyl)acetyl-CoA isomerase